jgi:hypothetical protein
LLAGKICCVIISKNDATDIRPPSHRRSLHPTRRSIVLRLLLPVLLLQTHHHQAPTAAVQSLPMLL